MAYVFGAWEEFTRVHYDTNNVRVHYSLHAGERGCVSQ